MQVGMRCAESVHWASQDGVRLYPELYPGLMVNSSLTDFQVRTRPTDPPEKAQVRKVGTGHGGPSRLMLAPCSRSYISIYTILCSLAAPTRAALGHCQWRARGRWQACCF